MRTAAAAAAAAAVVLSASVSDAYCNGGAPDGSGKTWPPHKSTAFKPGWNGLAQTPFTGWRSWYAYYTQMNQDMITGVIDALAEKNRTVKGWEGKVSLCDLGYCSAGIDEGAYNRAVASTHLSQLQLTLPSRTPSGVSARARVYRMGGLWSGRGPHPALSERYPRHQPKTLPRHEGPCRLRPQKRA